jgi:anti-sigma factor RsiW
MMTVMDKDRLAAFVDGELSPEEAAAVVLHLADTPVDQAYVDDLFAANEALAQAFGAPLSEPVPEAIHAAIMGPSAATNVVAFRPRRALARSCCPVCCRPPRPQALLWGRCRPGRLLRKCWTHARPARR